MKKDTTRFITISNTEIKIEHRKITFLLVEGDVGVYSMGRCMRLYQMDGLKKTFIRCIGWTKPDGGYETYKKNEAYLPGLVTKEACKQGAIRYINSILN
jgi:hypothetical protein